jgi:outer membrane protein assembly factor BamE (lipoprotein component of BamABCDE complex)
MRKLPLVVLLAGALAGCSSRMGLDNIRSVKIGMTDAELLSIMGKPYLTKANGDKQTWVWMSPMALSGASMVSFRHRSRSRPSSWFQENGARRSPLRR